MLKHWLLISFENYRRNLLSTGVNILGLMLGFAGFILALSMWQYEKSFEQWNPFKKDIYFFQQHYDAEGWTNNNMSYIIAETASKKVPEVEDYVLLAHDSRYGMLQTENGKKIYTENGQSVSEHFFNFFPFTLLHGSYKNVLNAENKIAISEGLSKTLFGNQNPVGKQIIFQDSLKMNISAVYKLPDGKSSVKPDYLILSRMLLDEKKNVANKFPNWGDNSYQALLKLKKGADPEMVAQKTFKKFVESKYTKDYLAKAKTTLQEDLKLRGPNRFYLTRLDKTRLEAPATFRSHADTKNLKILLALSVLILILSAINLINLKSAQASQRAKEIGVKKAIGIRQEILVLQLLFENFLQCLVAFFLSWVLVEISLPSINSFIERQIETYYMEVILKSSAVFLLITLFSGIIPAIYISNFKPIKTLRGNFSRSSHGIWIRNSILVVQLGISFFFIVSTIVVFLQARHIMMRDLGFLGDQRAVLSFRNSIHDAKKYEQVKKDLLKIKGVKEVSFGEASPLYGQSSSSVSYGKNTVTSIHGSMDYNFFDFWGIKLLEGRKLDPKISNDTINNAVVNESLVKKMGWKPKEALGKKVQPGFLSGTLTIVGVVKDYSFGNVGGKTMPVLFFHYKTVDWKRNMIYNCLVKLDETNIIGTTAEIRAYWKRIELGYPFEFEFIDKSFNDIFNHYQKQIIIFGFLSIVVLLVAILGLFALSTLLLSQMKKDIVVKKAIGASASHLILDFTRRFIWIIVIAVILSIPATWLFIYNWLKNFEYRIDTPYWPFLATCIFIFLLTLTMVALCAWHYTKISLAENLKYE